ncbi:MAG TPA: tetratricopeptide repeat protein [Arenimonas sp.]|nr:tetratricopeptide repeat protein [Arenimonas sp.]
MSKLITSALKRGDSQQALELANALVEQAPNKAESHYWLALAYQHANDKSNALLSIDKALTLAPESHEYIMLRSVILLDERDLNTTQYGLMDALALNPNQLNAYVGLIHIALAQKNISEAKRLLKLAERINADDDNVIVATGSIAQAEGDLETALKNFTVASEVNPNNPLALTSMGVCFLQKQMPAFAEQAFKRAMELAPKNVGVLRGYVQSQINQEAFESAEQSASELLEIKPDDIATLHLRARLRQRRQDNVGALSDIQALRALLPDDVNVLSQLCSLLIHFEKVDEARELLVSATQQNLNNDYFWQLRNGFESAIAGYDGSVITEWLQQMPNSPFAHEAHAIYLEYLGDFQAAQNAAEKALSISEKLPSAQFVKLRQEIRDEPKAALARAQKLATAASSPEAQRMILSWLGVIHDRLQEFELAASAFAHMSTLPKPAKILPVLFNAQHETLQTVEGQLLWAPVGARVERIFNVLSPILGNRLLVDRNQPSPARQDGFGPIRFSPDSEQAGTAVRWRAGIQALGFESNQVVDWLPQWDAYTDAELNGAKLLVLTIDPRDAFLNWMVFDNAQAYKFLSNLVDSAIWLTMVFEAIADSYENKPDRVSLIKLDQMNDTAFDICQDLQKTLGLDSAPDAERLAQPILSLGGMANQFPAGHWRHYQAYYPEVFARLTPVAVRLGYPET